MTTTFAQLVFWDEKQILHTQTLPIHIIQQNNAEIWEVQCQDLAGYSKICLKTLDLVISHHFSPKDTIFSNGFQSWTTSREHHLQEKMPPLCWWLFPVARHYCLANYGDYHFVKSSYQQGCFHSFTYTYARQHEKHGHDPVHFWGSLNETAGYTIFFWNAKNNQLTIHKDCEGWELTQPTTLLRLWIGRGSEQDILTRYFEAMSIPAPQVSPCTGWTSWYNYYHRIDWPIIQQNLQAFQEQKVPIQFFQMDDGYQKAVGDWIPNEKFPLGKHQTLDGQWQYSLKPVSDAIHEAGYQAGLWLAPMICEQKSSVFAEHPDWLVRKNGQLLVVGHNPFNWSGHFYALDFYHPGVREFLAQTFQRVLDEWQFDLVKLDFLYAAALVPGHGRPRGQIMAEVMQFLRKLVGNKKILGCGVPLGAAFGQVDYCRIGSDVALSWEDRRLKFLGYRERVSTINSLTSTIGRHHLNRLAFLNDPDVFILRQENQCLTPSQQQTLLLCNLILGGLVFTSDHIAQYDAATRNLYRRIFPHRNKVIHQIQDHKTFWQIHFSIQGLQYLAYVSQSSQPQQIDLTTTLSSLSYFKQEKPVRFFSTWQNWFGSDASQLTLPPYHCECLLCIPTGATLNDASPTTAAQINATTGNAAITENASQTSVAQQVVVAGSTGHIFPGSEIEKLGVDAEHRSITVAWHPDAITPSTLWLQVPTSWPQCQVNGKNYICGENAQAQMYLVQIERN